MARWRSSKTETHDDRVARYEALENDVPTLTEAELRLRTRRSVLTGGAAGLAGLASWRWVQGQPEVDRIPQVLRDTHEFNEAIWRRLYRPNKLAPTFDPSEATDIRVNGRHGGLENDAPFDIANWQMRVVGPDGEELGRHVMEDDLLALPQTEMTVEHKCVEGWSNVVTWGGSRFSDFVETHYPQFIENPTAYVALETPPQNINNHFYVGLDRDSMMHPQTLLASRLNGEELSQPHGAPIRLTTPLKYGTKQIKRIGTITFTNERPADYWTERGYDWYAGL